MSTAFAMIQPDELDTMQRTASLLVASGYFTGRNEDRNTAIAQLATKILAGRELGYAPYTAVQGIHIIQGKPQISANLMAAAVKAHPRYDYRVLRMADTEVVIRFFENGQAIGDSSFSSEDAKRAGTQNIQKFPRNMLFARALSNGVRWFCPDVFYGNAVYVEGELGEAEAGEFTYIVVDRNTGEVVEPESAPTIPRLDDVEELPFDGASTATEEFNAIPSAPPAANGNGHKSNGTAKRAAQAQSQPADEKGKMHGILAQMSGGLDADAFRLFLARKWSDGKHTATSTMGADDVGLFTEWLEDVKRGRADVKLPDLRKEFQSAVPA